MFCHKCGASLVDGAEFCTKCGTRIKNREETAPQSEPIYSQPAPEAYTAAPDKKPIIIVSVIAAAAVLVLLLAIIGIASTKHESKDQGDGYAPAYEDNYEIAEPYVETEPAEVQPAVTKPEVGKPVPDALNAAGDILVEGIPAVDLIGMSEDEVQSIVGGSWSYSGPGFLYEYGDDDWIIFYTDDSSKAVSVNGSANHFSLDGKSLYIRRSELTAKLGPNYETSDWEGDDVLEWQAGNNVIDFYFKSDSKMPYEVTLKRGENYSQAAEEDYPYGYEEDYSYSYIDPELVGRWRSYDGGTLEIKSNGDIAQTDFIFWTFNLSYSPYCQWSTDNGQITANSYFYADYVYEFSSPSEWSRYDTLKLSNDDNTREFKRMSEGKTDLYGQWIWNPDRWRGYSMELYSDGTGIIDELIVKYDLIWGIYEADGKNHLEYTVNDTMYFDYKVYGVSLEIFTEDGTRFYTKVGN